METITVNVSEPNYEGNKYHYTVGYWGSEEFYVEGNVVFNDGVTAVIKVTDSYEECWFQLLYYNEVKQYIPSFYDAEAEKLTEYLCLDVETEYNLFFRDPDTDAIMLQHYDEEGKDSLTENEKQLDTDWQNKQE